MAIKVFLLSEKDGSSAYVAANDSDEAFSTYQKFYEEEVIKLDDCTITEVHKDKWQLELLESSNESNLDDKVVKLSDIMETVTYSRVIAINFE